MSKNLKVTSSADGRIQSEAVEAVVHGMKCTNNGRRSMMFMADKIGIIAFLLKLSSVVSVMFTLPYGRSYGWVSRLADCRPPVLVMTEGMVKKRKKKRRRIEWEKEDEMDKCSCELVSTDSKWIRKCGVTRLEEEFWKGHLIELDSRRLNTSLETQWTVQRTDTTRFSWKTVSFCFHKNPLHSPDDDEIPGGKKEHAKEGRNCESDFVVDLPVGEVRSVPRGTPSVIRWLGVS